MEHFWSRFSEIFIDNKFEESDLILYSNLLNEFFEQKNFQVFENKKEIKYDKEKFNFSSEICANDNLKIGEFDTYKLIEFKIKNLQSSMNISKNFI